ncbi:hypothetical protein [Kingella pumchi]|uniref:Uncharacterized protein n=1 Tax=Kingella pumchi TaxID=2779506 RepID=A0ABS9NPM3_9NEIS|nr:hypothetical protein [Kingella pumchi]MCG6504751.1 hypothetical protein [Kingella pumchi]
MNGRTICSGIKSSLKVQSIAVGFAPHTNPRQPENGFRLPCNSRRDPV